MKKGNTYSHDEIDLRVVIKKLWEEKILILSISIICGLLGFFYGLSKLQEFKAEIILKNPSSEIFEPYNLPNYYNKNSNNNNNNNNNNNTAEQFISNFKLNLLSLDNLQSFLEESREFDNFKEYLKLRNISAKQYFSGKRFGEVKEKNTIVPNKYFLKYGKEVAGDIFLNKYVEFIKKETIVEIKGNIKLSILNTIDSYQHALELASKIQLEKPFLKMISPELIIYSNANLIFYEGTTILSAKINFLNKKIEKLENDQFNFKIISELAFNSVIEISKFLYFAKGIIFGIFLSLGIVFLRAIIKK